MSSDAAIEFKPLTSQDIPLIHRWLNQDFVAKWYTTRQRSYEEFREKYLRRILGQEPTRCFLITLSGTPIGYIQTYMIRDYPDYARHLQVGEDAAGLDLFIGERDCVHKGLGPVILRRFLRAVVFAECRANSCVVGPEPENIAAIRAYEKAGFRYLKTVCIPGEERPEYLMRTTRQDQSC